MDTTSRRPQLPALSYLDVDKIKREEESYQSRNPLAAANHSAPAASPTYHHYPSGPPPYTHSAPQHANTYPGMGSSVHTPPASRRTSGDEQDSARPPARHSLPSISEALGPRTLDSQTQYSSGTPTNQAPAVPAPPLPAPQSSAPRSPPSSARRSFPMEPPPSQSHAHFSSYRSDSAGPNSVYTSPDIPKPAYGSLLDGRPPLNSHAEHPPPRSQPASTYTATQTTSPSYDRPPTESTSSIPPPPPPSSFSYGYQSYPPRHTQPSTNGNSGPIYQPSTQFPAPEPPAARNWKSDSGLSRYVDERSHAAPYGESVKRHLEAYDFEEALNEVRTTSNILSDFSRRYGDRMHANARQGVSPSILPGLDEMNDMIHKAGLQMDSLTKVREMILDHHAAYEQQMAESRHKVFAETPPQPPQDHLNVNEEMKGGFAGGETKKRRGRAAAPGRCHSCQRSETPEWRRGPDGARTLCNACGLHFAKMARKQNSAGQSGAVQSSNLRPKEG